jgi:hypothetical protein
MSSGNIFNLILQSPLANDHGMRRVLILDPAPASIFKELPMKTLFLHPPSFDGFDGGGAG